MVLGAGVYWCFPLAKPTQLIELDFSKPSYSTPADKTIFDEPKVFDALFPGAKSPWLIPQEGEYLSEKDVAHSPRWVDGIFGFHSDYPKQQQPKKDSFYRVEVEVYVNQEGKVQAAKFLFGGNDALREFVLQKLYQAKFEPASDTQGKPVCCKLSFPIDIEVYHGRPR